MAQDNRFVCFTPGDADFYRSRMSPEEHYGFVFDARWLIFEMDALAGIDLLTEYDARLHEIAERVAAELGPKPIDEDALAEFLATNEIDDPRRIALIRRDEASWKADILYALRDGDTSMKGVDRAMEMFVAEVQCLQQARRKKGMDAWNLLHEVQMPFAPPLELLVPTPVPIAKAIGRIEEGRSPYER